MKLKKNIFTSKADTLKILQKNLKKSHILPLFDFTVKEWESDQKRILQKIEEKFSPKQIIVRSSALGEDSIFSSKAGEFLSIQNIFSNNKKDVSDTIQQVIGSYGNSKEISLNNKILIQEQANDVICSGVVFSQTIDNSPYFVLNYEEGGSTDGVTQGKINNTIKIFRNIDLKKLESRWYFLILAIKEIENFTQSNSLDIEFGIDKNNRILLFQVRPLVLLNNKSLLETENKIQEYLKLTNKEFFSKMKNQRKDKKIILSDMTDWNPAEIIGNQSNLLDYSLYDYLIMKKTWHQGRTKIGYFDVKPFPLMTRIGLKSYVDVFGSFNSLTPNNIDDDIREKLVNFYADQLEKFPHLYDKIEFELVFSCFDLTTDDKLSKLKKHGFTHDEIEHIKSGLLEFTNNLLKQFPILLLEANNSMKCLKNHYDEIIENLENSEKTYQNYLYATNQLLVDCVEFGTLPFSTMARVAFVSNSMLKSLSIKKILKESEISLFMNSIKTPLSELRSDIDLLYKNKLDKSIFLEKYGHLRPGTYDINASRYDQLDHFPSNLKITFETSEIFYKLNDTLIKKHFVENSIYFNELNFSDFVLQSISLREELKFHFTRNLSLALEYLASAGEKLGLTRKNMSNMDIATILNSYQNHSSEALSKLWKSIIVKEQEKNSFLKSMVFPSIISCENDLEIINYFVTKPNFITKKSLSGNIENISISNSQDISGKIILLENADPGYDWIFTQNPLALITKYGGAASHMAIRCSEINLPAAIGCGDLIYQKLLNANKVLLDCSNEQIIILDSSSPDEESEIKKTLKSIGYIK